MRRVATLMSERNEEATYEEIRDSGDSAKRKFIEEYGAQFGHFKKDGIWYLGCLTSETIFGENKKSYYKYSYDLYENVEEPKEKYSILELIECGVLEPVFDTSDYEFAYGRDYEAKVARVLRRS